jgi:fluoride ion exporter CrcB/FEX
LKLAILFAIFLGGALGSLSRYAIWLGVQQAGVTVLVFDLVTTSIVNVAGAAFLGFVHSTVFKGTEKAKAFWGSGFAGGFTTMSGLALITAGESLGLSDIGYLYWLAVAIQFVVGVLAYWFVRSSFEKAQGSVR